MKFRLHGAALAAAMSALLLAAPAMADNYPVKDGSGATQTFAAKLVSGILHPLHVMEAMFGGVPTPVNMTNSGALDITCVAGCGATGNTLGAQGTITAADVATSSTAGQGGVSAVTGAPTANSYVTYAISGASGGALTISGTFVATSQIEASYDGGAHYTAASGLLRGTNLTTASITAPGAFSMDLNGVTNLRVRATAYTSGTETVNLTYSSAAGMTKILNGVKAVDSGGADATDTTNHAVKVSVVAGGGSLSAKANAASQTSSEGATTDPLSMDLHRSLRVLNMDSSGNVIDPNAALPAGTNVIGKVSAVDSAGTDATDTTNHAIKVNIVAGASSGAVAQGSTTSGQTGGLTQGAVTTAAPTYTTGQTSPLSLTTAGALRVDGSAVTLTVQGGAASGATRVGNPFVGGGTFNTTFPTVTNGQGVDLQTDNRGGLYSTQEQAGVPQLWAQTLNSFSLSSSVVNAPVTNAIVRLIGSGSVANGGCDMTDTFCNAGAGVQAVSAYPNSAANTGIVPVVSSALESCHVLKASAGNLYRLSVNPSATAGMILVLNLTAAPSAGAVTPIWSQTVAASGQADFVFEIPIRGSTGLVACFSSATTPFTYTVSATAMISAQVQ